MTHSQLLPKLFLVLCSLGWGTLYAQNITLTGTVTDATQSEPLIAVPVILLRSDSSMVTGASTNLNGQFSLIAQPGNYILKIGVLGYTPYYQSLRLEQSRDLGILALKTSSKKLRELQVEGAQVRSEQKGDTVQYNADAFKTNPDATLEDLVKKMPGVTVENGQVKAGGETVQKVLIDGKEFFGDDATTALKNLPAEVVEKIQVFDKLSDQAQFTGFDDGNARKTMNVVTRGGMKDASFGKFFAGAGTDDRFSAGASYNKFKGNRRITLLGQSNNINQQNFSAQDLVGLTAGNRGGGMGGGMGGGGMMRMMGMVQGASDPSNFLVSNSSGINTTHALGLNYSDSLSKSLKIQASYFFNNTANETYKTTNRNTFLNDSTSQQYRETSTSWSNNLNHRLNLRLEYTIDTSNSIIYTPRVSWQGNQGASDLSGLTSRADTNLSSILTANNSRNLPYSVNNNLLLRHKFRKAGRTVSLALNADWNERNGYSGQSTSNTLAFNDSTLQTGQQAEDYTNSQTYSANVMYTEPLGKALQLFLSYAPSATLNYSDKLTQRPDTATGLYTRIDSSLSNRFDNLQYTQRGGAGIRLRSPRLMGVINVNYQQFTLESMQDFPKMLQVNRSFRNVLPFAMLNFKFSSSTNLRVFYRAGTNAPTVSQLQNVLDNSSPLQLSMGNPDLDQERSQTLTARFGTTNTTTSRSLFFNGSATFTNQYIGSSTLVATSDTTVFGSVRLRPGAQLTRPVNLDGYMAVRSLLTYSMPVKFIRSTLNLQAGGNYTLTPGQINGLRNETANTALTGGLVLASNISEKFDFTLSYTGGWNLVENTLQPQLNNNYQIHTAGARINWLPWKGLVLNTDVNYNQYLGLGQGFDQQYILWNAYLGYKFLKKQAGELKLSVFDILNQNNAIGRTVTETYVEDSITNVLKRYFMLTFTYTLRAYKPQNPAGNTPPGMPPMGPGGFGPPPGMVPPH
jgi:outer membrane receptor protein involved in Fe transport